MYASLPKRYLSPYLFLMLSTVLIDLNSTLQRGSNGVSHEPSTYLPEVLEQGNIVAPPIVQDAQEMRSSSGVPPIVVTDGGSRLDNPDNPHNGISYAELDEASRDFLDSWSLL